MGDSQRGGRNVGSKDGGIGQFFRESNGDAAGARADIDESDIRSGEARRPPSTNFANRKAIEILETQNFTPDVPPQSAFGFRFAPVAATVTGGGSVR